VSVFSCFGVAHSTNANITANKKEREINFMIIIFDYCF
jgi:hypothetical protein